MKAVLILLFIGVSAFVFITSVAGSLDIFSIYRRAHSGTRIIPRKLDGAQWENHPSRTYEVNWMLIAPNQEVLGAVNEHSVRSDWAAWVGQRACGTGEFMTVQAAKDCVEKELGGR